MEKKRKIVALVPMKAHSARVESKNFRNLAGKPLYRWILEALLSLGEIDRIVINTDARAQLAETGLEHGHSNGRLVIRDRKDEICGDFVSMNHVLADDIENVESDIYLMTHTTNPLLSSETIREAISTYKEALEAEAVDSLFSVNRVQTRFYRADGSPVNHDPNNLVRTQDLEPWFEENSNLYLFTRNSFRATGARIGTKPMMYETPSLESIDIDGPDDWSVAEALLLYMGRHDQTKSG